MTKKVRSTAGVAWPGVAEKMWSSELNIKFTVPSHYKHISLEQKECAYYEKSAYYKCAYCECAYYERA